MKTYKLEVLLMAVIMLFIIGCEEEESDPPQFTNGLMATIGDREFVAKNLVECSVTPSINGSTIELYAQTNAEEEWIVKFLYDPEAANDTIFISEDNNFIKLTRLDQPSSELEDDYYIDSSQDNASLTYIVILNYVPNELIEAEFEGFIYKTGLIADPLILEDGYFVTTNFNK